MNGDPLGERVARLEAVLPEIRDDIKDLKELVADRLEAHEMRISTLEKWRSYVAGISAAAGAAAGLVGRSFIDWLRGH